MKPLPSFLLVAACGFLAVWGLRTERVLARTGAENRQLRAEVSRLARLADENAPPLPPIPGAAISEPASEPSSEPAFEPPAPLASR